MVCSGSQITDSCCRQNPDPGPINRLWPQFWIQLRQENNSSISVTEFYPEEAFKSSPLPEDLADLPLPGALTAVKNRRSTFAVICDTQSSTRMALGQAIDPAAKTAPPLLVS